MKQIEVTIMGHGYILGCPEGGEALLAQAVTRVDQEMSHIRDSGKVKARERIAVLAALNLAYLLAEAAQKPEAARRASPPARESDGAEGGEGAQASPAIDADADADTLGAIDVEALMRRVDAALGGDGQLL
ncbi:MAG: cell division protein ZapA [Rubrivivax sp. SCN 71-131]|nr:MAG: cell division protein ZapA [Rubrivivax sp. SCN 71-131]